MKEILDILNEITLREHNKWQEASSQCDVPTILQAIASIKICSEIAKELGIRIIEPVRWEHIE